LLLELVDKNIILTGASSGIGLTLAEELAKKKNNLALLSRRIDILENLAEKLRAHGTEIIPVECDVSKKESVREAFAKVRNSFRNIDIAILNSGVSYRGSINPESNEDRWEYTFRVNTFGLIYCAEELIKDFKKNRHGIIVGTSSLADARGFPLSSYYSASKAAASHYLESLRIELRPYNVKVLTIKPGFVKTPMTDKNEFYMPLLMSTDKAVKIIIKGIQKEKTTIHFPFLIAFGSKIIKILPDKVFDFLLSKRLPSKKSY
jgi:short-subunit dehydrogenase